MIGSTGRPTSPVNVIVRSASCSRTHAEPRMGPGPAKSSVHAGCHFKAGIVVFRNQILQAAFGVLFCVQWKGRVMARVAVLVGTSSAFFL